MGRAGRHLLAALQHRAHRGDARRLPRDAPRARRAGRRRDRRSASFGALFYLAELVLSPIFGILSDRQGHHRVMLYGPVFGAVAVIMTGFTADLGCRPTSPSSSRRSPATSSSWADALPRGRVDRGQHPVDPRLHRDGHGRRRAAAGQGRRPASRARRCSASGPASPSAPVAVRAARADRVLPQRRAVRRLVPHLLDGQGSGRRRADAARPPHVGFGRYVELLRSSHVWLLAPTWIAVNASIGLWFSQSIFQFAKANPDFPDQVADARLQRGPDLGRGGRHRDHLRARPAVLGQPVQEHAPDDDHPVRDPRRRRARGGGSGRQPRRRPAARSSLVAAAASPHSGCS